MSGLEYLLVQVIAEHVHILELCEALMRLFHLERLVIFQLSLPLMDV